LSKKDADGQTFLADPAQAGQRIDRFLSENLKLISRSRIQKLIAGKMVLVNGSGVSKHYRLSPGDSIQVQGLEGASGQNHIDPEAIDLDIVYEDEHIAIISKEAGMVTHPASGNTSHTLVNALLYHFKDLSKLSGEERAGIVHRLDKDTSGLLIAAKNERVHYLLSDMFKDRAIKKTYIALAEGVFEEEKGKIDLPIGRSRIDRRKMSVSIDKGRSSVTRFEVASEFRQAALLHVSPMTGRTHQIRVHLSYIGHPIIADRIYGSRHSERLAMRIGLKRQFLHAWRLEFVHPITGKKMEFEDPLPEDLSLPLERLKGEQKM
jgi:23S rRNA pseudouridine1911/1915/1917 synthase